MNILVIGNGFDLAHGLPTKYTDFLDYCKAIKALFTNNTDKDLYNLHNLDVLMSNANSEIMKEVIFELIIFAKEDMKQDKRKEWTNIYLVTYNNVKNDNVWIDYFLQCDMHGNENWIDFESEISNIIKEFGTDLKASGNKDSLYSVVENISNPFFSKYLLKEFKNKHYGDQLNNKIIYKNVISRLEKDLNRLILALEFYLSKHINEKKVRKFSQEIANLDVDHILSFNYTNTYERLYNENRIRQIECDYIHGKANFYNIAEFNNMVLGIDEYLPDDRKDKDTDFIAFKKYYQRIYKGTGCEYKEWVDQIKESWKNETEESKAEIRKSISREDFGNDKIHRLYIFGHSLDVTDKDVLRDLILNDNVHTTIFYHSKDELGKKIANLVKVIGQDELIKRTGGSTKTIEFKEQQEMKELD